MKINLLSATLAAGVWAATGSFCSAQQVEYNQLSAAVQQTINARAGAAGISSIRRMERNGIPAYEVRLNQRDAQPFYVSETGTLLNLDNVIGRPAKDGSRKANFSELPPPVQTAVRSEAGTAAIEDIDVVTKNGQTVYDVAFKRGGRTVELTVDPNGKVLKGGQAVAQTTPSAEPRRPLAAATKVTANELPAAVQNTLRTYTQGARIEDVDKGTVQGRTVYEVGFKHKGEHVELRVAEDGTLIRDDVSERFLATLDQRPGGAVISKAAANDWRSAPARVPLSNASKVSFRELPTEVRNSLRNYAGTTRIDDIDKGTIGGRTVYQASFRNRGENMELQVAEDGLLINDQVNQRFLANFDRQIGGTAVGRAASWETLTGGSASQEVQLSNTRGARYSQLPSAVQTTLRTQAGAAAIEDVKQGTLNGRTVYQATFEREGKDVEVLVSEDGSILRLR